MDELFYNRYKCYESFPIADFKHIPEISRYNSNFYMGVKRKGSEIYDLIYEECDELANMCEYYHVFGDTVQHIGYAYEGDKYITLCEEELT